MGWGIPSNTWTPSSARIMTLLERRFLSQSYSRLIRRVWRTLDLKTTHFIKIWSEDLTPFMSSRKGTGSTVLLSSNYTASKLLAIASIIACSCTSVSRNSWLKFARKKKPECKLRMLRKFTHGFMRNWCKLISSVKPNLRRKSVLSTR